MIVDNERKDMVPVSVVMIIPALVKNIEGCATMCLNQKLSAA